jgi:hypothetical protein
MTGAIGIAGEVSVASLDRSDWIRLVWGFFWRGLCLTLASSLGGLVAGFAIGFCGGLVAQAAGVAIADYGVHLRTAAALVGLAIGLGFFAIYVRWILRARFGSLRLALIRTAN